MKVYQTKHENGNNCGIANDARDDCRFSLCRLYNRVLRKSHREYLHLNDANELAICTARQSIEI